jgi:hypothetical protein
LNFDGYFSDGTLRTQLNKNILNEKINENAFIYDIINLNDENILLDISNSI